MKRFTTFVASIAACLVLGSTTAQAQLELKRNEVASQLAQPMKRNLAPRGAVRHLAPAQAAASSIRTVLIDEDFSLLGRGSEAEPDTINYLGSQFPEFAPSIYFDPSLTKDGTWAGDWCMAAGDKLYMRTYNMQLPCALFTPLGDYSGHLKINLRVKAVPCWIPKDFDDAGNITDWRCFNGTSLSITMNKGGYDKMDRCNTDMPGYGMFQFRIYPHEGWQEIEVEFDNYDADNDAFITFHCSEAILIDHIKVTAENTFLPAPHVIGVTDFQRDQFTVKWEPVRHAYNYYIDFYKKVYTSDEEEHFAEDFENYTEPQQGWSTTATELSQNEGMDNSKGLIMHNGDTLTMPVTQGTYKQANIFMRAVDPSVDRSDPWWSYYFQGNIFVDVMNSDGSWQTLNGSVRAASAANGGILPLTDQANSANTYFAYRIRVAGFSNEGYVVVDNIDIVANCAFEIQRVNGPKSADYGGDYTFYDYTEYAAPCEYTFTDLDPETEYYYAIRSHYQQDFSEGIMHHALGISAPVAKEATEIDSRGTFTANWEAVPKAMNYTVSLYGILEAKEDTPDMTVFEEDFSRIDESVTTATSADAPEVLGNSYEETALDELTTLPGWKGLNNTVAQGWLGCNSPGFYGATLTTPVFDCNNDDKLYLSIKAHSMTDEELNLNVNGLIYSIPFDENGDIDGNFIMPISGENAKIRFSTQSYSPWMLGYLRISQDVKKGGIVKQMLQQAVTEELSYVFTGLSIYDYELYGYTVTASYEHEQQWTTSAASNLMLVDLDNEESKPFVTAVTGLDSRQEQGNATGTECFTIDGRRAGKGQKGLIIIRQADGSVRKMMVR